MIRAVARLNRARSVPERKLAERALRTECELLVNDHEDAIRLPPVLVTPRPKADAATLATQRLEQIRREFNLTPPRTDILGRRPKGTP